MIDATFIEAVSNLARKAQKATILDCDKEPGNVYFVAKTDGSIDRMEAPPPVELPMFADLDSLVNWGWTKPGRRAWVSLGKVVVTTTDARRSAGSFVIGASDQLTTLEAFGKVGVFDQKGLIKLLRTTFAGCVPDYLVDLFRKIKIVKKEQGESEFQLTKANIGRSLESELTGTGAIPERVTFDIPVVAEPFVAMTKSTVEAAFEADALEGRFYIYVLPGEILKAKRSAELQLLQLVSDAISRAEMSGEFFPVFMGRPE